MANWFNKISCSGNDSATQHAQLNDGATLVEGSVNPQEAGTALTESSIENSVQADSEEQNRSLALLSEAQRAIAQAQSFDELKQIRDKAEAARKYAQVAGMGLEIQNYAAEVKLRAERRAGEFLTKLKLHGGDRRKESAEDRLKLEDIGVTKDQSSRWQLAALVPTKEFERYMRETRDGNGEVTTTGLIRIAKEIRAKQRKSASSSETEATEEAVLAGETITLSALLEQRRMFGCIYAAPPWGAEAASVDRLAELPIAKLTDGQSHLHLWTTQQFLFEAKELLERWGFEYRGLFVWVKPSGSETDYWLDSHELMLLGLRGEQPFRDRGQLAWCRCDAEIPGGKPERTRRLIERVSPGPYLELFSGRTRPGWSTVLSPLDEVLSPDLCSVVSETPQ